MRNPRLFIFLLFLVAMDAGAEGTDLFFSYTVEDDVAPRIIQSLLDGHRSEIRYKFRIFRRARGIRKIFGDALLKEGEILYTARWDALDESFVVLIGDTSEQIFPDASSFMRFFLSVVSYPVHINEELLEDDYLVCRWRIQPVKLVPPLTLMTLIKSNLQIISSWQQTAIEKVPR